MNKAFDYIAMPKGQAPGGPVQASTGEWYIVVPALADLADVIDLVERGRAGRPVTKMERIEAAARLNVKDTTE